MDVDQLSYGSLCVMAVATTLLWLILRQALGVGGKKDTRAKLPPGPWNLPIIGSLHHLVGMKLLPHRALLHLSRRHGPLMLLRLGEVPNVIVSTPEAAMEVLKMNDLVFATRLGGPTLDIISCGGKGLIFAPYGEHWRQMRKVCVVEVLSARQVRRFQSIQQGEVARLVESVSVAAADCAVVDVGKGLAELTSNIIASAVFGGKFPQQEAYFREIVALSTLVGGFSLVDLFPSSRLVRWLSSTTRDVRRGHARVQRILEDIIQEREEKNPTNAASSAARDDEDLLDVLLRLQRDDTLSFPLTSEIIGTVIFDIFGAASDTTASTIEWAMAELIRNPEAMARAKHEVRQRRHGVVTSADVGELHYLRMVIKETLRLHPAGVFLRASQADCQVMGYRIPKGTAVMINGFAVGTDPAHWGQDAAEFRPERFEDKEIGVAVEYRQMEFFPFGAGRRQCPGALLASTIMDLVLANLLYHFDWVVPGGETLDMGEVFGVVVHTRSSLRLQATPYHLHLQDDHY